VRGHEAEALSLVVDGDAALAGRLRALAAGWRLVFLAGLPGTGKSLLAHQLAHLAAHAGRRVHLLQWDVARPVIETSAAARRYPAVGGVTHAVVRKAAGLWVREAIARWHAAHPAAEHVLIGETPLVGNRFLELAQPADDAVEPLLAAATCAFVIAVPSREVRRFLEAERERRMARPLHPRERDDAPPEVLRDLWREITMAARTRGITAPADDAAAHERSRDRGAATPAYDPDLYRDVYARVLRRRHVDVIPLDVILPTAGMSVYDFAIAPVDLTPTPAEAEAFIALVERRYPDAQALERDMACAWQS
jgi:hypothetical protein